TLWSDQAPYGVTEVAFADKVNQPFLIPEGAMGAMYDRNPNGTWKLVVKDTAPHDTGILYSWAVTITTLPLDPPAVSTFPTDNTSHPIPDGGTLTATLNVNSVGPVLDRVTVQTYLTHTNSGDLRVVLTAPSGLTTTLVDQVGNNLVGLYYGTL